MEDVQDVIVKEIPVYVSKQLADHLYIYQYPLRPPNFKYDTSVIKTSAIKPKHQEIRLEHALNTNSVNFDVSKAEEIALNADGASGYRDKGNDVLFENEMMDKQCFTSSKAVEDSSKYAVGVVHANEIHITPLKGIIQLRPHFPYLDRMDNRDRDSEKAASVEMDDVAEDQAQQVTVKFARMENERLRKIRERSFNYLSQKSAEEPWCHTKWHHPLSDAAELERMKLLAEGQDNVGQTLDLSSENYLRVLVPPDREEDLVLPSMPSHILSPNCLKSLPLLEQCRVLLKNAKIITFQQLMSLLVSEECLNAETVLRTLPQVATVIRGCWVVRSDVLYPKDTFSSISGVPANIMCRARDYVLYLFTQNQFVDRRKVSAVIKLPTEEIKEIFTGIARLRHNRGWDILLPTDNIFIDKYQDVVQRQRLFWEAKQKQFNSLVSETKQTRQRHKSKSVTENTQPKQNGTLKRERERDSKNSLPAVKKLKLNSVQKNDGPKINEECMET